MRFTPSFELTEVLVRPIFEAQTLSRTDMVDLSEQIGLKLHRMVATWANRYRYGIVKSPWISSGGMFDFEFGHFLRDRSMLVEQRNPALTDIRDSLDMLRDEMRDYLRDHPWRGAWGRLEIEDEEIVMRTTPLATISADQPLAEIVE